MNSNAPHTSLGTFITQLESFGELQRIRVEADPLLEIAAITEQVCKQPAGGKALLFEHPRGSRFPVATNLFGSRRRTCLAWGVPDPDILTTRVASLLATLSDPDMETLDRQVAALPGFRSFAPRLSSTPPWSATTMTTPGLHQFPFLQNWPGDGSASGNPRYLTLPLVFTANPDGSSPNCGMYRAQVHGDAELAVRWKPGSGAARHHDAWRRTGKEMPVAIALGGDPALTYTALFPLPGELDEVTFAGFLRASPLEMAACRTVPLCVPASAEMVIEGYADPVKMLMEGPFGNHTGLYSPAALTAHIRITSISRKESPVIPATVVGPPPMEDCWMAAAWEKILLGFLRSIVSALAGIHVPAEWAFQQSAVISLENPATGMVRDTAALLGRTPWFAHARVLIFIDSGIDTADIGKVAWRCINSVTGERNLFPLPGGGLAIDATGMDTAQDRVCRDTDTMTRLTRRWNEYGF